MFHYIKTHAVAILLVVLATSIGTTAGVFATLALTSSAAHRSPSELPLYATASAAGDSIAAATGPIDDNLEGLFLLDYKTGRLTMDVMNFRDGRLLGGHFVREGVHKDLKVEDDKPAYLMLTAQTRFGGGKVGAVEPARCVVYVVDQNTGNWIGYGMSWNIADAKAGRVQKGFLAPVLHGTARPEALQ